MNLSLLIEQVSHPTQPRDKDLLGMANRHEPYYHFLYRLAEKIGNDLGYWVVFGVNDAVCCSHIMIGNPTVDLMSIDERETALARQRANEYEFVYHIHGSHDPKTTKYFQEMLPYKIGVVFFDTTHIDWVVLGEWERVKPYLAEQAILIFDDVHAANDSVMLAINKIPGKYMPLDHLHKTLGFGVKVIG